jgi:hypothetical protein
VPGATSDHPSWKCFHVDTARFAAAKSSAPPPTCVKVESATYGTLSRKGDRASDAGSFRDDEGGGGLCLDAPTCSGG